MPYRVVQPFGARPGEWTLISAHATVREAFDAIDRLSARMVRTGAPSDAVELIVVDDAGARVAVQARSDRASDGSEAFFGGAGLDALIFGSTDREAVPDPATGVRLPTLFYGVEAFPQGIPTADVSGLNNFCTIEASPLPEYDYLVRFRGAAGNIIVTVRIKDVEQVFCTLNGGIGFANVRGGSLEFVPVSQEVVGVRESAGRRDDSMSRR